MSATKALPLRDGGSQRRAWVSDANGHVYQLKLPTPETRKVLFNEALGVTLAQLCNLNAAPSALIDVPEHIRAPDNLGGCTEPGTYFGSRWQDDYVELGADDIRHDMPAPFVRKLYLLLAYDLIIFNGDRKYRDLLHVRGGDLYGGDLVIVDHGNALCGVWWPAHLDANHSAPLAPGLDGWAYRYLTDPESARAAALQIVDALAPKLSAVLDQVFETQADAEPLNTLTEQDCDAVEKIITARIERAESLAEKQITENIAYLKSAGH